MTRNVIRNRPLFRRMAILSFTFVLAAASCADRRGPNPPDDGSGPDNGGDVTEPHDVVIEKELMITDLSVVNSDKARGPDGAWSFGHAVTEMAGPHSASQFTLRWLQLWEQDQAVNGFTTPKRSNVRTQVINPWKSASGCDLAQDDAACELDFEKAPFRLLAIVNRIDLMKDGPTGVLDAGEGRFIYGVLGLGGQPLQFTVIFEYEQLASNSDVLIDWSLVWHKLGALPFGAGFNTELQRVTERFAKRGVAPAKPNGSALNQIRTNEIALDTRWELREFRISAATELLEQVTVKQTPSFTFLDSATLSSFANGSESEILGGTHIIPESFSGAMFLAADAPTPLGFFWRADAIQNNEVRHLLSLATCNGCHGGETNTPFLHVAPRGPNEKANLSGFLTGANVEDPLDAGTSRNFNDLAARRTGLQALVAASTSGSLATPLSLSSTRTRRSRVH